MPGLMGVANSGSLLATKRNGGGFNMGLNGEFIYVSKRDMLRVNGVLIDWLR